MRISREMSHNIFDIAQKLITDKKFDDARTILRVLGDDPKALRWLNKLDEIDPPNKIVVSTPPLKKIVPQQSSEILGDGNVVEGDIIPEHGKWVVNTSTAEIDDSQMIMLMLNAEQVTTSRTQYSNTQPALVLRWKDCQLEIFVMIYERLVSRTTESASVRIRFNKFPPTTLLMNTSTSKEAYFFSDPRSILRQILTASRMVLSYTPMNANSAELIFDLNGITEVIKPVKALCGKL